MRSHRKTLDYAPDSHPTVKRWVSLFSLLGGGIAWLLHLLTIYVISDFGCVAGWGERITFGISVVSWMLLAATVLTGALAAAASWASHYVGTLLWGTAGDRGSVRTETQYFVARVSLLLNGIFAFIILAQAVPIFFFLRSC